MQQRKFDSLLKATQFSTEAVQRVQHSLYLSYIWHICTVWRMLPSIISCERDFRIFTEMCWNRSRRQTDIWKIDFRTSVRFVFVILQKSFWFSLPIYMRIRLKIDNGNRIVDMHHASCRLEWSTVAFNLARPFSKLLNYVDWQTKCTALAYSW